ncbi:MAG: hypothetical protein LBL92_00210 [Propionibacteriaceae bacterium]|nr:hypothetical protein [Propionibacteriaceae bacterium]
MASLLWRATAEPPPSTQELTEAARLVVEGTITAPEIGIYPDDLLEVDPENWGIVGFPTWFWAKNPSPDYTTEKVQTTSVRGHTLRVTAKFNYSHWDPGDGGRAITCDLGTEAIGVDSPQRSPSGCDHIYTKVGVYTVTATWYFTVDWSGAGQEGFFDVSVDRTGTYRVEEVHIVNVPPR